MSNFRRFAAAAICAAFVFCQVHFASAGLIQADPSQNEQNEVLVSVAQQFAQNTALSTTSTVAEATTPAPQHSTPTVNPAPAATVAVVTPPTPESSQNQPAAAEQGSPAKVQPTPTGVASSPVPSVDRKALGDAVFDHANENARSDPDNWVVHVYKSRHKLDVYFQGRLFKSYHAVFGRSRWMGAKQWEGDLRTPEGNYLIIAKYPSRRFAWFLRINYPNAIDEARFDQLRADREIPPRARAGGAIGIHGSDNPLLNVGDVNWTTGCISLVNSDIEELARLLPTGTLVVIEP
jgi:lipoprotein-anchoring transpeptidase ErfK/SrfK